MVYFSLSRLINPLNDRYPRTAHAPVGILPVLELQRILQDVPSDRIHKEEDSSERRCGTDLREVEWECDEWDVIALTKHKGREGDQEEGDTP